MKFAVLVKEKSRIHLERVDLHYIPEYLVVGADFFVLLSATKKKLKKNKKRRKLPFLQTFSLHMGFLQVGFTSEPPLHYVTDCNQILKTETAALLDEFEANPMHNES